MFYFHKKGDDVPAIYMQVEKASSIESIKFNTDVMVHKLENSIDIYPLVPPEEGTIRIKDRGTPFNIKWDNVTLHSGMESFVR